MFLAKRSLLSNGDARPSISQHSSMSQADDFSPYERVKYDKIKNKEHPYAQVQPNTSRLTLQEENQIGSEERLSLIRLVVILVYRVSFNKGFLLPIGTTKILKGEWGNSFITHVYKKNYKIRDIDKVCLSSHRKINN